MPAKEFDLIFNKLTEKHGAPFFENGAEQKSSLWDLGNSILTVEGTEEQEFQIQLWSKEFYNKINKETKI